LPGILPRVIPGEAQAHTRRDDENQGERRCDGSNSMPHERAPHLHRGASAWLNTPVMARRKKKRKFEKGTEARRMARENIGTPPAARVIPDRRTKPPKHKKRLIDEEFV